MNDINKKSQKIKKQKHLVYKLSLSVREFNMINAGDKVLVCFSGGKDSFTLLDLLDAYNKQAKEKFEIGVVHIDHQMPGFPIESIEEYLSEKNYKYNIVSQDIFGTIKNKIDNEKKVCSLCARLRRGAIYNFAEENGFNKIALGHHMDDVVETLFLNMFYGSKLKAIPPVLFSDNGKNTTIRPLSQIREHEIIKYSEISKFPVISGDFCGARENTERKKIKSMLSDWQKEYPGRIEKIFTSIKNIEPRLLADKDLFQFIIN